MGSTVKNIWDRIAGNETSERDPEFWSQRTTIAALLFRVMPIDGEIHGSERLRLNRILADEFSIDQDEVDALVLEAQGENADTPDLSALSGKINANLSHQEKLNLISHMWEMVFADGKLHEYELLLVERVAELLGLEPSEVSEMMSVEGNISSTPR